MAGAVFLFFNPHLFYVVCRDVDTLLIWNRLIKPVITMDIAAGTNQPSP